MSEVTYRELHYQSSELKHHYGPNVHILSDPFALTQLARLCAPGTVVPEVSNLVRSLYTHMLRSVVNREFPRKTVASETRMAAVIPEAAYRGQIIDPATRVTTVDIARAGILPSQICFDELSALMNPQAIRQDHLMMSRLTAEDHKVTGAGIGGDG